MRLDLVQVRLDVRVGSTTLIREIVLSRRALINGVGRATGLRARGHVIGLTNRDDQLLHGVQETEVDIEGFHRVIVRNLERLRLVMPELQEAHMLLVHERGGLGTRDVHVVATQLGLLQSLSIPLRQRSSNVSDTDLGS